MICLKEQRKLPWEDYIPENGRFWVKKASTAKSKLFSAPDIQSIVKKAMVDRMKSKYKVSWFDEDGDDYPVRVFILKDQVTISLDTTGIPLHKRDTVSWLVKHRSVRHWQQLFLCSHHGIRIES